jgi:3',5'-cyclic AMP phosphodiesterase CpdA
MKLNTPPTNPADAVIPRSPAYDQTTDWLVLPENPDKHPVDVFWVYPTVLANDTQWLMDIDDPELRQAALHTVTTQASVFEGQANIYAPAYRQTNIGILFAQGDTTLIHQTANQDVEAAFKYYLENYNNGHPFILAGHSQGSEHLVEIATRLWGTSPKHNLLVAAYTLGWSVTPGDIEKNPAIKICKEADQTGCFIAYNSIAPGKQSKIGSLTRGKSYVVNPLSWKSDSVFASASLNLESTFFNDDGSTTNYTNFATAQVVNSGLQVLAAKPEILGPTDGPYAGIYHSFDYSLFYKNIKDNVALRIKNFANKPKARFAILSDPHYCNESLIDNGTAFNKYLISNPKLFHESDAIMEAAIDGIIAADVDFVLVAGDMTKDGELTNHHSMTEHFKKLKKAGISTWVTTGNHDINNSDAKKYDGESTHYVDTVTPDDFVKIYANNGYADALDHDQDSLSYVCEPVPGVKLIVIDSCIYAKVLDKENPTKPVTGGRITAKTEKWIIDQIHEAKAKGEIVYGMMHHGILEHFSGQSIMYKDFVVQDFDNLSKKFAQAGLEIMFTGHFHASDIVTKSWSDKNETYSLTDIETGSLASYPVPYRICTIHTDGSLDITTKKVEKIDYVKDGHNFMDEGEPTFQEYAKAYGVKGLQTLGKVVYSKQKFNEKEAELLGNLFAESLMVHYTGDEIINEEAKQHINAAAKISKSVAQGFLSLQTDLYPADNNLKSRTIFTITPNYACSKDGDKVTIKGNVLGNGNDITSVTIAGIAAPIISQTDRSVTVTAQAATPGTGDIEINSKSKGVTNIHGAFTYTNCKSINSASAPVIAAPVVK